MKALEYIKSIRDIETGYDHTKEHHLDEAIAELEAIQNELNELRNFKSFIRRLTICTFRKRPTYDSIIFTLQT